MSEDNVSVHSNESGTKEIRPRYAASSKTNVANDSTSTQDLPPSRAKIDREKICPMLLRMFCREGGFHEVKDFASKKNHPVDDELIVYTWKDASLKELASLIKEVHMESQRRDTKFTFRLIAVEARGRLNVMELGSVFNNGKKSFTRLSMPSRSAKTLATVPDEERTLEDARFVQGDYIDVAICYPYSFKREERSFEPSSSSTSNTQDTKLVKKL